MAKLTLRDGTDADLPALTALEARSFASDRLSRRSLRRFLAGGSARLLVASRGKAVLGYGVVLLRSGSAVARLYSIAVDPGRRGSGLGKRLLADAERVARSLGRSVLRLEVRKDNWPAIRLYERRGYRRIGIYRQYYADKADALRYEKRLGPGVRGPADDRRSCDCDEDRSPADFGVPNLPMTRSSQAGEPVPIGVLLRAPASPAAPPPETGRGREA